MIDRDNVIGNLEQNIRWIEEIECHQFPGWGNVTMAMRDAVELLKEQEPIPVQTSHGIARCGNCGKGLILRDRKPNPEWKYCAYCGKRVEWDA